jgi:transcriptional regulator with XRE-family HTH domain
MLAMSRYPGASARMLRYARRRAGLTQRELAERAGVAQPTVARIESGAVIPRVDTLDHLLRACGHMLDLDIHRGRDVDTTLVDQMLDLDREERLRRAEQEAQAMDRLVRSARPT